MGMWELVVVLIVGLIVLGPERLPVAVRTVSRWVKTVKQMANNISAEVNEELRVHELHQNLKKAEQQGMDNLSDDMKQSVSELEKAAQSVTRSYDNPDQTVTRNYENPDQKDSDKSSK